MRVLVTGAARGLGLAISRRLAADGAQVALADVDEKEAEAAARDIGDGSVSIGCDVRGGEQVRAAVEKAVHELGGLDALVNNAGIEIGKLLVEHSDEEFARVLDVNVRGVFHGTKYAVPALAANGGGVIVNMASVAGIGGSPLLGAYCASKGAVIRLTEVSAIELREAGIRVCAVCPAFIDTAMVERLVAPFEAVAGQPFDEVVALKQGRMGRPEEVAETVA